MAGFGFGDRGEFAGPGFEFGDLRERPRVEVELVVAFQGADAPQGGGAGFPVSSFAGDGRLGHEVLDLFGGFAA